MSKREIFLPLIDHGTGQCSIKFMLSLVQLCNNYKCTIMHVQDSRVPLARNIAANHFIENTDTEYLLFIDMDIVFSTGHIDMLFESDHEILCGLYFLKDPTKLRPCFQTTFEQRGEIETGGIIEVPRSGTGFMRIHRSVFEKMKNFCSMYRRPGEKHGYDFFPIGLSADTDEWLSEDWKFCDLARAAGFKIHLDTRIQLGHDGRCIFPMPHQV